ncbi:hypothetical protein ACFWG6_37025 [Streptomyces erythrochromogenes]
MGRERSRLTRAAVRTGALLADLAAVADIAALLYLRERLYATQ